MYPFLFLYSLYVHSSPYSTRDTHLLNILLFRVPFYLYVSHIWDLAVPTTNINAKALLNYHDNATNKEYLLSKLHCCVFYNNEVNIAKAATKKSDSQVFTISQIVLLAIPAKNRLTSEAPRLLYRVIKVIKGVYTLLSQFGRIKGAY